MNCKNLKNNWKEELKLKQLINIKIKNCPYHKILDFKHEKNIHENLDNYLIVLKSLWD